MKKYFFILLLTAQCLLAQTYFQKITTGQIAGDTVFCSNSAWGDYDNDGFQDIAVAQYTESNSNLYPILLYHNNGDGSFTRVNNNSIAQSYGRFIGISWGDYDNDGKLDLFIGNRINNNMLFHNEGNGNFTRIFSGLIVNETALSTSCNWCDYDRDGWLDLFVANSHYTNNYLYRNNGNSTFTKITSGSIVNDAYWSKGSEWGDYDNDGWQDLFVVTYKGDNDLLYHNNGNGTFTKITSGPLVNDHLWGVQCAWADYDNDGFLDMIVTTQNNTNRLYHNERNGNFLLTSILPAISTSWYYGVVWGDYNNDGYVDLHIAKTPEVSYLLKNNNGNLFSIILSEIVANEPGSDGNWGDYDNNGKLDLFVTNNPHNFLYKNIGPTGNYLICKLKGCQSNRTGIGARVIVKSGNLRLTKEVSSGDGNENMLWQHFGLGTNTIVDSVIVYWPYGPTERKQVLKNIAANSTIVIDECLIGIENCNTEIPSSYNLYQNYPNPFNPSTKIKFDVPSEVRSQKLEIRLVIYDVLGKEVATLVNEQLSPGTYEVEWNASNLPSGIYFYRFITNSFTQTNKLILIK